jgi:predicted nucleic-acid-binding Zn-ribbon protein
MNLNPDQLNIFLAWLNAKVDPRCPACGKNHWSVGNVIASHVLVEGKIDLEGPMSVSPMVQVICENCAYVRLFSATKLGLWESPHSEPHK